MALRKPQTKAAFFKHEAKNSARAAWIDARSADAFLKILSKENLLDNKWIYSRAFYSTFNQSDEHIPPLKKFRRLILQSKN